jgi:hypothetical protein
MGVDVSARFSLLVMLAFSIFALGVAAPSSADDVSAGDDVDARLRHLESEIDALKRDRSEPASAEASAQPAAPAPVAAAPPAEVKKEALVFYVTPDITFKPGLRLQTRYQYDTRTNNNEIYLARFRLKAGGEAYEIVKYYLEMKIDNTGKTDGKSPSAAVENGWLDFTYNPDLIGRAGLYDVPFSRDALTSDSKLLLIDRSLIKDALTAFGFADNGIGVMARGRPFGGRFEYMVGGFNNDKFNGLPGSNAKNTGSLMPMARVAVDLLDPAPLGGYADYRASYVGKGERLTLGANGGWLGDARDTVNGFQQRFDLWAWGVDAFFNKGPFTLQGEYDWFRQSGNVSRSNHGWFVQGGYLVEPLNRWIDQAAPWFPDVEVAARYQGLNANSYRRERERQTTVGMNFYIRDHNLKIQTDYSFRQIQDTEDRGLYQLQLQLDF